MVHSLSMRSSFLTKVNKLEILKILKFFFRINIFIFSYLLYLIQLVFIFFKFKQIAKIIFKFAAYFCSLSLGISYSINKKFKYQFLNEDGIYLIEDVTPNDMYLFKDYFSNFLENFTVHFIKGIRPKESHARDNRLILIFKNNI